MNNHFYLSREIIARSVSADWEEACKEWELVDVYFAGEPSTCLCTHTPIVEICVLKNRINGIVTEVGNCCVKKFIGLPSDPIFQAIKRIRAKIQASVNEKTLEFVHEKGVITDWERSFYIDTLRKRKLSEKQSAKRIYINRKILSQFEAKNEVSYL